VKAAMSQRDSVDCKQPPGPVVPVIDRNRCEGKRQCVAVCPFDVFSMAILPPEERRALSLGGKLKGFAHRWQQAFASNADACHACGLCVAACPEHAIKLVRRT
jgi:NAD-dependent dihydropyrimidine dehydrogenase PreA subunit